VPKNNDKIRINREIRVPEVRVVGSDGENLGILPTQEAISKAFSLNMDLIEISPKARPPVAKITDYGKFQYTMKKKAKEMKAGQKKVEIKIIQVKIGTGDNDLKRKAAKVAEWLAHGHRVKVDLYLWGRYKFMDYKFLKTALEKFLAIIPESFKIAVNTKKDAKRLSVILEFDKTGKGTTFDFQEKPSKVKKHEDK
jgi:translation initiation factor IF-3